MMDNEADNRFERRITRIKGHWRWITVGTLLCALASFGVSLFFPNVYRATTKLLVSESRIGPGTELPAWQYATLSTYEPFVDNDTLIHKAIKKFHLDQSPYRLDIDSFRRKDILDVQAIKSTRLVEISIEFPDAHLAADLANYFAQGAVDFNNRLNDTGATSSRSFLAEQLKESEANLADADSRRTRIRARTQIEDQEKELEILLTAKDKLSTQSQGLKLQLAQDDSKAKYLQRTLKEEPDTFRLTKSVLSDRLAEKAVESADRSQIPTASISEESLNTTKEKIRHDFVGSMADAAAERAGLDEANRELAKVNLEISRLLVNLAQTRSEQDRADNDYKLAREAVEAANRNYQNASVNASSKSQDIEQLAPAAVPVRPVKPRLFLNTFLGTLMGFVLMIGAATARESFRDIHEAKWDAAEEVHPVEVSRM